VLNKSRKGRRGLLSLGIGTKATFGSNRTITKVHLSLLARARPEVTPKDTGTWQHENSTKKKVLVSS